MDKWTRYSLIGLALVAVILLCVMAHLQRRKIEQMDRWLDQNQKQTTPWVDDVERLLDRVLPEKKNARPTN